MTKFRRFILISSKDLYYHAEQQEVVGEPRKQVDYYRQETTTPVSK